MSQDNDRIPFENEPSSIAGSDEETLSISEKNSGRSISHNANLSGDLPEGHQFSRPMRTTGTGATRCRIFRSKISIPAIESLEEHINEWLDSDDIDVKDIGHLVGKMHGKTDEDCIIVMAWY
jgi:hypothetical protein